MMRIHCHQEIKFTLTKEGYNLYKRNGFEELEMDMCSNDEGEY